MVEAMSGVFMVLCVHRYTQVLEARHTVMNCRLRPKIKRKESITQRRKGATKSDLRCAFASLRETSSSFWFPRGALIVIHKC